MLNGSRFSARLDSVGFAATEVHLERLAVEVTIPDIVVNRISRGRIEEGWLNYDALGLMQRVGVILPPEQAGS